MVGEVIAGLGAFKTMLDIAKGLKDINGATIRNAAVIELQEKIFVAREEQSALLETIRELEKEVAQFKAWNAEKERYQLTEVGVGAFTYVVKPTMRGGDPTHCVCSTCYQQGQEEILQKKSNRYGMMTLQCCSTTVIASENHENYPFKREFGPL